MVAAAVSPAGRKFTGWCLEIRVSDVPRTGSYVRGIASGPISGSANNLQAVKGVDRAGFTASAKVGS